MLKKLKNRFVHWLLTGVHIDRLEIGKHSVVVSGTGINMGAQKIENVGAPDSNDDVPRRVFSDLTGRWTLAQAHRGALDKIMVFKGAEADPVEEDKPAAGYPDFAVGDLLLLSADTEEDNNTLAYTKIKEIEICHGGTLRIKFDLKSAMGDRTCYGRIYRNDEAVGTEQTNTTTSYQTKSEDIAGWSAGDKVQLYAHSEQEGWASSYRNFRIYVDEYPGGNVLED